MDWTSWLIEQAGPLPLMAWVPPVVDGASTLTGGSRLQSPTGFCIERRNENSIVLLFHKGLQHNRRSVRGAVLRSQHGWSGRSPNPCHAGVAKLVGVPRTFCGVSAANSSAKACATGLGVRLLAHCRSQATDSPFPAAAAGSSSRRPPKRSSSQQITAESTATGASWSGPARASCCNRWPGRNQRSA
jgi:hypothetical protein